MKGEDRGNIELARSVWNTLNALQVFEDEQVQRKGREEEVRENERLRAAVEEGRQRIADKDDLLRKKEQARFALAEKLADKEAETNFKPLLGKVFELVEELNARHKRTAMLT